MDENGCVPWMKTTGLYTSWEVASQRDN